MKHLSNRALSFRLEAKQNRKGRRCSIFDGGLDSFDAFDKVWSQRMQAVGNGRAIKYIPEDPKNGKLLKLNPFYNAFTKTKGGFSEDGN